MKKQLSILVLCVAAMATGIPAVGTANDEMALDYPVADLTGEKVVSVESALAIARMIAEDLWDTVDQGPAIPCTDFEGAVFCYMVPFRRDGGEFPDQQEVFHELERSRNQVSELNRSFAPPYATGDDAYQVEKGDAQKNQTGQSGPETFPSVRPDGVVSHRLQYMTALMDHRRRIQEQSHAGKYGTIVIGSRTDQHPVMAIYHFLPPFFTTGPRAAGLAASRQGKADVELRNIVFLDPAHIYFRFLAGDQQTLINCKTLEVVEDEAEFISQARAMDNQARGNVSGEAMVGGDLASEEIWDQLLAEAGKREGE